MNRDDELAHVLALLMTPEVGAVRIHAARTLARREGVSLEEMLRWPKRTIATRAGDLYEDYPELWNHWRDQRLIDAREMLDAMDRIEVATVLHGEPDYPASMATAMQTEAPPLLFMLGAPELASTAMLAVVGATNPSPTGLAVAGTCARWGVSRALGVVSGGAKGVDTEAHESALSANGHTVMVIPEGIGFRKLSAQEVQGVRSGRVAILSAFPPYASWSARQAVMRNGMISALARMACVVEPHRPHGSARAGRCALRQGLPVYVLPALAGDVQGIAHGLFMEGARPLLNNHGRVDTDAMDEALRHGGTSCQMQLFGDQNV